MCAQLFDAAAQWQQQVVADAVGQRALAGRLGGVVDAGTELDGTGSRVELGVAETVDAQANETPALNETQDTFSENHPIILQNNTNTASLPNAPEAAAVETLSKNENTENAVKTDQYTVPEKNHRQQLQERQYVKRFQGTFRQGEADEIELNVT